MKKLLALIIVAFAFSCNDPDLGDDDVKDKVKKSRAKSDSVTIKKQEYSF